MAGTERFDISIGKWLEETAPNGLPQRVLAATFERTRRTRQNPARRAVLGSLQMPRFLPSLGGALVVVMAALVAFNLGLIPGPGTTPTASPLAASPLTSSPSVEPSSLAPVACRRLTIGAGVTLDCSRDGTLLLIQKNRENLFVLHPDGSETQVTEQLSGFSDIPGSAWPSGATISPDGSRVVFAGLTEPYLAGKNSCHNGALFAVGADGGPAELLWASHIPQNGIVRDPTFSPDGTQIAFADGYCDWGHTVWVMNADGSDAHEIVSVEMLPGAGHVNGLAWSPVGDRIALRFEGTFYTFAPDGSQFTQGGGISQYCWPGRRC